MTEVVSHTLQTKEEQLAEEFEMAKISLKLTSYFACAGWQSTQILKVEKGYYDQSLTWRMNRLSAPTEAYLCKSMIMENTAWKSEHQSKYYPRYYCVVVQYVSKMNSDKLLKAARAIQNDHSSEKIGKSGYNLRLLNEEESASITGYGYNGVTPFLFNEKMPILISEKLAKLSPQFFFLGGGHADLKLRVSFQEFVSKNDYDVYATDIADTIPKWSHLQN